jgi:hypothetical protein
MLVYDVTDATSFSNATRWLNDVERCAKALKALLCAVTAEARRSVHRQVCDGGGYSRDCRE